MTRVMAAHEVLRGDVAGDEADPDEPPGQVPAGQEVVGGHLFAAGHHHGNHGNQDEIRQERRGIEG